MRGQKGDNMMKKLFGMLLTVLLVVATMFIELIGVAMTYVLFKSFVIPVIFSGILVWFTIKNKRRIERRFLI